MTSFRRRFALYTNVPSQVRLFFSYLPSIVMILHSLPACPCPSHLFPCPSSHSFLCLDPYQQVCLTHHLGRSKEEYANEFQHLIFLQSDNDTWSLPPLRRPIPRTHSITAPAPLTESSEEHTSELQTLMRTSYAVFCS